MLNIYEVSAAGLYAVTSALGLFCFVLFVGHVTTNSPCAELEANVLGISLAGVVNVAVLFFHLKQTVR